MRRASALLALLAPALAACGTVAPDKRLSYATVQALNPGVDGKWVLEEFPNTQRVERDPSGKIQRISYGVLDPQGKSKTLTLWFDQNEVLQRKEYSGQLVRPPPITPPGGPGPTSVYGPPPRR